MSEIFTIVKNAVTARQAAERYGLVVNRTGMARCPFHDDASPSMKLDERYYCFGCGATGDAVDLTAKILGLTPKEAAMQLASDFGIPVRKRKTWPPPKIRPRVKKDTVQDTADWVRQGIRSMTDYLRKLHEWKEQYAPKSMKDENWHSLFLEALEKTTYVEYVLDEMLAAGRSEYEEMQHAFRKEVENVEKRLERYAGRNASGD